VCLIFTHGWKDLLCTVNVQHNCAEQHCKATGHRDIYQERQLTTHTQPTVAHNRVPNDLVLNTAQMQDAIHVQGFRITSESLDLDDIVHQSAVNELSALRALDRSGVGKSLASKVVSAAAGPSSVNVSTRGWPHPRQISHLIATA
jgi:predicted ABC-class ATPase